MVVDLVRKVRNKDLLRVNMVILETGDKVSAVLKPDPDLEGLPGMDEYSFEEFSKDCDRW